MFSGSWHGVLVTSLCWRVHPVQICADHFKIAGCPQLLVILATNCGMACWFLRMFARSQRSRSV